MLNTCGDFLLVSYFMIPIGLTKYLLMSTYIYIYTQIQLLFFLYAAIEQDNFLFFLSPYIGIVGTLLTPYLF